MKKRLLTSLAIALTLVLVLTGCNSTKVDCSKESEPGICYWQLASDSDTPDLCGRAGEFANDCYLEFSLTRGDPSFCKSITETSERDNCVKNIAMQNDDANICEGAETEKSSCYHEIAQYSQDTELCRKTDAPWTCTSEIGIATGNLTLCDISGADKYNCVMSIAIAENDLSKCSNAGSKQEECEMQIRIISEDLEDCTLFSREVKSKCYLTLATKTGNASFCDNSDTFKEDCYHALATQTMDDALCEKSGKNQEQCYYDIATFTGSSELCNRSGNLKETCIADLSTEDIA